MTVNSVNAAEAEAEAASAGGASGPGTVGAHAVRRTTPRARRWIRVAVATAATSSLVFLGATAPAGAVPLGVTHLLQGSASGRSAPAPRYPKTNLSTPLNEVNFETLDGSSNSFAPQTAVPTLATYVPQNNHLLTVKWSGGSVQLYGFGAIKAGRTYVTGISATIGKQSCSGPNAYGAVKVDQVVTDPSGNVQSVALQFLCEEVTIQSTPTSETVNSALLVYGTYALNLVPSDTTQGYYLYGADGSVTGFGNNDYLSYVGSLNGLMLNQPIVGMEPTTSGAGYWQAAADGGVFALGDAGFYGSAGAITLNKPIVGMAATPDGKGYWLVASDGGVFAYGDAGFYGSAGAITLNKPIVGMAATPDGKGYWLVASDGGVFAYGNASFHGSAGAIQLNQPVVGMAATPDGKGYWLVASDGGVFAYGEAGFYGSAGSIPLNQPILGLTRTSDGNGYWFASSDGGVFAFGDAPFEGSLASSFNGIGLAAGGPGFSVGIGSYGGVVGMVR
jgi:hypothetical protein